MPRIWMALTLVAALAVSTLGADQRRPNIILFVADDLGYGEPSCQGNRQIPTPHIDSLARQGVRFTNGYVSASYCAPSRAGMMTGRYQTRFGFEGNPVGARNEEPDVGLPPDETTIAEILQDAGYGTALIGKWHLGGTAPYHPLRHGFDELFGFLHEGHYFVPPPYDGVVTWLRRRALPSGERQGRWQSEDGRLILSAHFPYNEPDYDANNPILRNGQPVVEPEYLTDALTREAVNFIERHRDRPFFLYLPYSAVHSPMQAKPADMSEFSHIEDDHRRIFAGMLRSMDNSIGAVLEKLRELNLEEATLVFFISDNGGPTKELTSGNGPLRDGKGSLYEGGIRVPFLMQWKGRIPAGMEYHRPVSALDVYATAAAVAGADQQVASGRDGVDLLSFVTGRDSGVPHQTLYWRMGPKAALRHGDWKIVRHGGRGDEGWELYHLAEDIGEQNNLAERHPEKRDDLIRRWKKLDSEMIEPLF